VNRNKFKRFADRANSIAKTIFIGEGLPPLLSPFDGRLMKAGLELLEAGRLQEALQLFTDRRALIYWWAIDFNSRMYSKKEHVSLREAWVNNIGKDGEMVRITGGHGFEPLTRCHFEHSK